MMASFAMQRCAPRRAGPMCAMEKPPPPVKTSSPPTRRPKPPKPGPNQLMPKGRNVAERMFASGGISQMRLYDGDQARLVAAVARHLTALREIPDFLPYLHVDADAVKEGPSTVCDGRGVFAARDLKPHELVTLYPATNELSLRADREDETSPASVWRPETYAEPKPDYAMFNGNPQWASAALRIEADPNAPIQPGFLGHLVNDAAIPPTASDDIDAAQRYLVKTTNGTNCHAVPFPSGMVAIATSKEVKAGTELLMTYSFAYDGGFMAQMLADPAKRKQMLTNAFATDMKVSSTKMEQLTAESLRIHAKAEILSRELLVDVADDE